MIHIYITLFGIIYFNLIMRCALPINYKLIYQISKDIFWLCQILNLLGDEKINKLAKFFNLFFSL